MNLDDLAGMFSQRTGTQQSISSTIMSTIMNYMMQHFMQKGLGGFLGSGGSDRDSMKSALSQLQDRTNNPNDELVQQVKNNCHLRDDNQARQYTQQAINVLREDTDKEPQGLQSLFLNFAGNQGFDLGALLGGFGGSTQQQSQRQGEQRKGDIGDLLGF